MRLALESDPNINLVRSYGSGVITVGTTQITRPCVLSAHALLLDWTARSIAELTEEQLAPLLATHASIVILGAGQTQEFPAAAIRKLCRSKAIALESMNLGAACRTYNILAGEERAVVAGLFP
jgi:uncharacterized protein